MKLNELNDKRILVLGFGKEGRDTLKFLKKLFPKKIIGIADQKEFPIFPPALFRKAKRAGNFQFSDIKFHLGKNYLRALKNYDIIIKSPGIPFKVLSRSDLDKVTTQTEIFFENCPGKIVGITGTKGKSTTSALIYKILKEGGIKTHLVGNIGKPVLNLLFSATPKDVYVYELSSHQLYNLKKSPQIAVFLNIYPEHLDYYRNFNEYLKAKANITKYQTEKDFLIYNFEDKLVREIAQKSRAKKIALKNYSNILKNIGISNFHSLPLIGKHNLLNMAAAIEVGKIFKIPKEKIKKAIENFKPLPHRLELVGTFKGITFYNDALSTIPETTILAMKALGKGIETLLLGGFDRKTNFKKLAKFILEQKNIKNLILFPTTGEKIWQEIKLSRDPTSRNLPKHFFVDNMPGAVKLAYQYTQKGKICLLSCASTSFSIFRDYKEKGNLFKKYVRKYGKR